MIRRMLISSVVLTAVVAVSLGLVYPLALVGIGKVAFSSRANGSLVSHNGQVVGSSLIGQNFLDAKGNAMPNYFQPRPSEAGAGYDPTISSASNFGPGDPRLVGFIPGFNTVDLAGNKSLKNPFATKDDPYCVPTDPDGAPVTAPSAGQKYARNKDGSYVCDSSTVPERAIAYRQLNGLAANAVVPNDAVQASGSGLDPDISVANARLQAPRVAKARHLPTSTVLSLISKHTDSRPWGFLGEQTVNVLDLNLALDGLH